MVGARGFEPPTPCTPCRCATRLRHAPTGSKTANSVNSSPRGANGTPFTTCGESPSAPQNFQYFFEFYAELLDNLLRLADIFFRFVAGQSLAGATYGEPLLVKQTSNLTNDEYVLALIVTPVASSFDRFKLRKLLFPIPQDVRFDSAQLADFADSEVPLPRYRREFVVIPRFQHRLPRVPS